MKDTGCRKAVHLNQSGCLVGSVGLAVFVTITQTKTLVTDEIKRRNKCKMKITEPGTDFL